MLPLYADNRAFSCSDKPTGNEPIQDPVFVLFLGQTRPCGDLRQVWVESAAGAVQDGTVEMGIHCHGGTFWAQGSSFWDTFVVCLGEGKGERGGLYEVLLPGQ